MKNANENCVNKLKSLIRDNMNMNRGLHGKVNFLSYFFVLYAYKRQSGLYFVPSDNIFHPEYVLDTTFNITEGSLFGDLYQMAIQESGNPNYRFQDVFLFANKLDDFDYSLYLYAYKDIIEFLIETMAMSGGKQEGEIVQPMEITELICYLMNKHRSRHIYNPFSGLASYAIGMNDSNHRCSYLGQELNPRAVLLSRLRMDAHNIGFSATVEQSDVFHSWGKEGMSFDTVVATPPFNQRIREISISLFPNKVHDSHTMEEYMLWSCLDDTEGCQTAIIIVPSSFLYRRDTFSLRKTICERKALEMVIDLPKNVFYGTGIPTSVLVLNLATEQDYVTFIDAQKAFTGKNRDLRLNVESIIDMIEGHDSENRVMTHVRNLFECDCLFSAYIYANEVVKLKENEHAVALSDLITETTGEDYTGVKPCRTLSIENFSTDFFKVVEAEDVSTCRLVDSSISKIHGPHIVLSNLDGKIGVYLHKGNTDFYIKSNHHLALKVNTQLVTIEYMAYMLLTSDWAKKISSYEMGPGVSIRNFVRLSSVVRVPVIDKKEQYNVLNDSKRVHRSLQIEKKLAELERLGYKNVYSDIIHILGPVFHSQTNIMESLEERSMDDPRYPQRVKRLIDTSRYIRRMINLVGVDFEGLTPTPVSLNIADFINEYLTALDNFSEADFDIQVESGCKNFPAIVNVDKDLLITIFDAMINNTERHGFDTMDDDAIKILNISYQYTMFNNKPFLLLSFSNNGRPMDDNFSLEKYITRGNSCGSKKHSGLGGYHIYTIVKKHLGFLNVRWEKSWSFIVDILLPANDIDSDELNNYEYEAI